MKKINPPLKIRNSKGQLYLVCPIIEKINMELCNENNKLDIDSMFEIQRHFDSIKEIAKVWQKELGYNDCPMHSDSDYASNEIANPYKYTAVLKNIRTHIKNNTLTEEKLNEILEIYL